MCRHVMFSSKSKVKYVNIIIFNLEGVFRPIYTLVSNL
jgi:hypothetical protein